MNNAFLEKSNRVVFNTNNEWGNIKLRSTSRAKKTPNIKVDINDLLSRVRDEKKKERKENLLFLGLIGSVIVITGIIASL